MYNELPFRNLSVRGSGSGEEHGIMRVEDHLGRRNGLQTHLRRHSGKFGHDTIHGSPTTAENYVTVPSFVYKIQRNTRTIIQSGSSLATPTFDKRYNNAFVTTPIPASDYQYTWVTGTLGNNYSIHSGKQYIFGYAPHDGIHEEKISTATGNITVSAVPSDQDRVVISDGTNRVYFIFGSVNNCPEPNHPLNGCKQVAVAIGGTSVISATNLTNAINDSILEITAVQASFGMSLTNLIGLTAHYMNEKFNNEIITNNTTTFTVTGMSGARVDLIPAITFPTASEIFGE